MTLRAGDRLGPYEITALLGTGGMGEVHKARDTRLGRDVAIKVLPAHLSANPELRARFEREARAISQLNHPHICSLHDIGSQDGVDYLVMEHLEGETLAGRLAKGSLPLTDVLRYGSEIASALDCAHRSGIVHRDLKPGNIMLTKGGAKLMDFGLARPMRLSPVAGALSESPTGSRPITAEGTIVGTFQYMAPEQLEGKETDARTDLWALGCVLYEMATGERAFEGTSQASLIAAILKEQPRPILEVQPMVPAVLRAIVERCLEKQPEERFQSARDLGFALETLGGSGSRCIGTAEMLPSRGLSRVPALAAGSVLGAAIIFLAVGLAWWQQWPPFRVPAQPTYERITFRQGSVMAARFTPNGREVLYSAAWEEEPLQTYSVSLENLQEQPVGPSGANLLNLTAKGDALLLLGARQRPDVPATPTTASGFTGTLAVAPWVGQLVPRERLKGVLAADISPDGTLAVVREEAGRCRLELPPGIVRAETAGTFGPVRFSPTGEFLAFDEHPVESELTSRVSLLDLRTGQAKVIIGPSDWLEGIAWNGSELWCSVLDSIVAARPDGSTREVLKLLGYVILEDISPSGRVLVSRHDWRFGLLAFGEEGAPPQIISRDTWPWLEDLAADGRIVFAEQLNPKTGGLYVASGDGMAAVKVGGEDTSFASLAPDRPWLASWYQGPPPRIVVLPTGAGEPRELAAAGLEACNGLGWTHDGRILVSGFEAGRGKRIYLQDPEKGSLTPVTEEGIYSDAFTPPKVSPDGTSFLARSKDGVVIVPLREQSAEPRLVKGVEVGEKVVGWCADSRKLFVVRWGPLPLQVWTLDPDTGRREKARTIDPKGYRGPSAENIFLTPDGKRGAMMTRLWHSELYVVTGLR
jgi:serine/threonine protein kinase